MINSSQDKASGKTPPEDFFGKSGSITRLELREKLKKAPSKIPSIGKWYTRRERVNMEKETFGKEYKSYISRQECRYRIRKLKKEKFKEKTSKGKLEIGRRIKYLKHLTGL